MVVNLSVALGTEFNLTFSHLTTGESNRPENTSELLLGEDGGKLFKDELRWHK